MRRSWVLGTVAAVAAASGAAAVLVADDEGSARPPPSLPASSGSPASVRLAVRVQRAPGGAAGQAVLRCGRTARGTAWLAEPEAARRGCRTARREARRLTGGRPEGLCTQQYGGPEVARVLGRLGTRRVARTFRRTDGCGIADWEALRPLLPRPG